MGQNITLDTGISAYLARPEGQPKGGIVVIQEIFGVNDHIRDMAENAASAGYVGIAPAFFDHVEKGIELDYDQEGMDRGRDLVKQIGIDKPIADVKAAAEYIAGAGTVGTVGFCWGGTIAFLSATRLGLPSASFYGARNTQFLDETPKAPVIFHFGAEDDHITPDMIQQHREKLPDAPIHVYEGAGHGFNCDRRDAYHAESASKARERTLAFFDEHVADG